MRVNGPGSTEQVSKLRKKQSVKGVSDDFDTYLSAAGEAEETAPAPTVAELSNVSALLSLQELAGKSEVDARAYKRGEDILDQLNELRMGLLAGAVPPQKLDSLAHLVKESRKEAVDPALGEILNDIEVRALVELEKYRKVRGE